MAVQKEDIHAVVAAVCPAIVVQESAVGRRVVGAVDQKRGAVTGDDYVAGIHAAVRGCARGVLGDGLRMKFHQAVSAIHLFRPPRGYWEKKEGLLSFSEVPKVSLG